MMIAPIGRADASVFCFVPRSIHARTQASNSPLSISHLSAAYQVIARFTAGLRSRYCHGLQLRARRKKDRQRSVIVSAFCLHSANFLPNQVFDPRKIALRCRNDSIEDGSLSPRFSRGAQTTSQSQFQEDNNGQLLPHYLDRNLLKVTFDQA